MSVKLFTENFYCFACGEKLERGINFKLFIGYEFTLCESCLDKAQSIIKCAGKPYCPSNGTEGAMFLEYFCEKCKYYGDDEPECDILSKTFIYDKDNEQYPKEWIYDEEGNPTCTKYTEEGDA